MRYYDLKRNWSRRVEPHLADPALNAVLVRDFNMFTYGRWRKPFTHGQFPRNFESCDWGWEHRGKEPRFWRYVKHAASHWLVNFNLRLAQLSEPGKPWHVVTSEKHSTVWDGNLTLFDFNFLAFGIPPDECFALADGEHLPPGQELEVFMAEHYSIERERTSSINEVTGLPWSLWHGWDPPESGEAESCDNVFNN
jgi:hypothetical protein